MPTTTQFTPAAPAGRSDQVRNRRRLVAAARAALAAHGGDVPLARIARRAGLSSATLYRHFPTRAALLEAVYERELDRCREILDRATAEPDARTALLDALRAFADLEARQPGFTMTLLDGPVESQDLASFRARAPGELRALVERARAQGTVRADLTVDDVYLALVAIRAVAQSDPGRSHGRVRRVVELVDSGWGAR